MCIKVCASVRYVGSELNKGELDMTRSDVTKVVSVILAVIVVVVAIVFLRRNGDQDNPNGMSEKVEIQTTPGTGVFAKLTGNEKQFLNSVSEDGLITVEVPPNVDIILKYDDNEEIFPYETWKEKKSISHDFKGLSGDLVTIPVNAEPQAFVFIKLPGSDDFIKPRTQDFEIPPEPNDEIENITPIRVGLKIPTGTTVKLVYRGREKVFPYEVWKNMEGITHNFSNP